MLQETEPIVKKKQFWTMKLLAIIQQKYFQVKNKRTVSGIKKPGTQYLNSKEFQINRLLNIIWKLFKKKWNGHSGGTAVRNSSSAWASSACSTNDLLISTVHFQRNSVIKPVRTPCYQKQNSSHCPLKENEDISNTCTIILTVENLPMFYVNVPNAISNCLS